MRDALAPRGRTGCGRPRSRWRRTAAASTPPGDVQPIGGSGGWRRTATLTSEAASGQRAGEEQDATSRAADPRRQVPPPPPPCRCPITSPSAPEALPWSKGSRRLAFCRLSAGPASEPSGAPVAHDRLRPRTLRRRRHDGACQRVRASSPVAAPAQPAPAQEAPAQPAPAQPAPAQVAPAQVAPAQVRAGPARHPPRSRPAQVAPAHDGARPRRRRPTRCRPSDAPRPARAVPGPAVPGCRRPSSAARQRAGCRRRCRRCPARRSACVVPSLTCVRAAGRLQRAGRPASGRADSARGVVRRASARSRAVRLVGVDALPSGRRRRRCERQQHLDLVRA